MCLYIYIYIKYLDTNCLGMVEKNSCVDRWCSYWVNSLDFAKKNGHQFNLHNSFADENLICEIIACNCGHGVLFACKTHLMW